MTCSHHPLLVAVLLVALASAAHAKPGSGKPPTIDCKALRAMSNAPMSFEQCEQLKAPAADMQQNRTGGERPGDDQMSCEQIMAELSQVSVSSATLESARESVAAGQNLKSTYDAAMAAATAANSTAMMQANPRMARLGHLVSAKKCRASSGAEQLTRQRLIQREALVVRGAHSAAIGKNRSTQAGALRNGSGLS